MKFKSTSGESVHIALTSGHTTIVTPEGVDIAPIFHKEAIAKGCMPVGVEDAVVQGAGGAFNREAVIKKALTEMLDGNAAEDFTANGKPDLRRVNARIGFQATRSEVDAIFDALTRSN